MCIIAHRFLQALIQAWPMAFQPRSISVYSFGSAQGGLEGEKEGVEPVVNSNHTSKILAVVRTLLKIKRKEPTAKALVFSWVRRDIK